MLSRLLPAFALAALGAAQTADGPVRAVTDPGVVTTRQGITPAGVPAVFEGRVNGVAFGATETELWVLTATHVYRLDWRANRVLEQSAHGGRAGLQGVAFDHSARRAYIASADRRGRTRLSVLEGGKLAHLAEGPGRRIAGGPAIAAGRRVAVPQILDNRLGVYELPSGKLAAEIETGVAPFGAALNAAGSVAYVTNWGGRKPTASDLTAPTGLAENADRVVVDSRGIASTGTVTKIDLAAGRIAATIPVGLHPTAIVLDEPRARLYVANNNSDSISVIDTATGRLLRTIAITPFGLPAPGIAPSALAVSPGGRTLYAACGGINAIAQIRTADGAIEGYIPTGWYPSSLALSPDGRRLAVGTLLGAGSGWREDPRKRYVHSYRGSVHVIDVPDAAQLASYSTAVAENNRLPIGPARPAPQPDRAARPTAVPRRAGEPSHIEHVVYIIKENRTYDQLFGDLKQGNGDPSLVMFGTGVTPNHRRLAEQFVLLDNFYATGGNSGDGHQWLTQANETAYCLWPGYEGRSYPFDGTDPIAYSSGGFIWDAALAHKRDVRVYGEFAGRLSEAKPAERLDLLKRWQAGEDFSSTWNITAPLAPLNKVLAKNYPPYSNAVPDVVRAGILIKDVERWEREGKMPNLVIALLPCDHTYGTTPGTSTPKAMVADNDLALGRIVEALSRTQFWKKMAIFVVEDDAQDGVDHVDGHRTVALAISPYTRRGHVDSTFYSHQSMLKTIELILGLPALSLFDLIANDMRASFQDTPDFVPYSAVEPTQSLWDVNPPLKALNGEARRAASESARMRWDVPDAAPVARLNRILWGDVRGWKTPYPERRSAVFSPLAVEDEDEEEEEEKEKARGRKR